MAAHADADHRDLGHVGGAVDAVVADLALGLHQHVIGALIIGGRHGEREIGGGAVAGDVLHDHVDVDVGLRQRAEDRGRDAGLVLHAADGDLRLVLGEGDAGDDLLFHDLLLAADQRSGRRCMWIDVLGFLEARAHEDADIVHHAELDRAHLHDLGAERGELEHLLVGDLGHAPRPRHHPRVGGVDAVDVGVDVAAVGLDRGRDRDRRGVRPAAAKRGDAAGLEVDALEARDHRHLVALLEPLEQLLAVDVENARGGMGIRGGDRQLPALPRARVDAHALEHDGEEPGGHLLAGRDHGIVFARIVQRRAVAAPGDQLVGDPGHRGDDDRHLMAGVDLALDVARDVADALDVGDRGAAELHHEAGHDGLRTSRS